MPAPERVSLAEFERRTRAGGDDLSRPLLIDFGASVTAAELLAMLAENGEHFTGPQYLRGPHLPLGDLIERGEDLEAALDARSVLHLQRGAWLNWPGKITHFHRDYNLWSVLNFSFVGDKVWHVLPSHELHPHHANLVLRGERRLLARICDGRAGMRFEQPPGIAVYLPVEWYHHVETQSFALGVSVWWTDRARLFQKVSVTDTWWLQRLRVHKWLKHDERATIEAALAERFVLERWCGGALYGRYLRVCKALLRKRLQSYRRGSNAEARRMQDMLETGDIDPFRNQAIA